MANAVNEHGPSARRVDPRPARTRAALVAAAQRLLAEGDTGASIQQITATAGIGFGSFYNHFTDKAELWSTAVTATLRAHGDLVAGLTAHLEDPAEVFCVGLRLTGRLQRRFPHLVGVLLHTDVGVVLAADGGLIDHARHDLRAAIDARRFHVDDIELALNFTAGSMLALIARLEADADLDADEQADGYAGLVLRALGLDHEQTTSLLARPLPDLPAQA